MIRYRMMISIGIGISRYEGACILDFRSFTPTPFYMNCAFASMEMACGLLQ